MAIVAGVDFGTLSVRVSIVDSERGLLDSAVAEYPLHRKQEDPEYATQSHEDHMRALAAATREAVKKAGVAGEAVRGDRARYDGIVGDSGRQGHGAARRILPVVRPPGQRRSGGDYRGGTPRGAGGDPVVRRRVFVGVGIFEAAPLAASQPGETRRVCHGIRTLRHGCGNAVRHFRPTTGEAQRLRDGPQMDVECVARRPAAGRVSGGRRSAAGRSSREVAGRIRNLRADCGNAVCANGRRSWGCKPGIPIPVGAFDAHWDAIGAGCADRRRRECGGHVDLHHRRSRSRRTWCREFAAWCRAACIHGGQESRLDFPRSATFSAPLRRARAPMLRRFRKGLERYRAGQTGLLRMTWDNGDRTVLVNPNLRGITLGWNLQSTAQDELFAAIEGTAFHTRVILERMAEHGVHIKRVINAGGIPQKNNVLNQVYANVLGRPVLVPSKSVDEPGFGNFCIPGSRHIQDRGRSASQDVPSAQDVLAWMRKSKRLRTTVCGLSQTVFLVRRSQKRAHGRRATDINSDSRISASRSGVTYTRQLSCLFDLVVHRVPFVHDA